MKKIKNKKICIVSDSFVPYPISATGMIYNLCKQFNNQGFDVITFHGAVNTERDNSSHNYSFENIEIISTSLLSSLRNKNNFLRLIFEIVLSLTLAFKSIVNYKKLKDLDLIIWYGPSAFLWFCVLIIKLISKAKVYYILRDIFPDWLVAVKLIKNKFVIKTLEFLSFPQYIVPNNIGVETDFNKKYLEKRLVNKNFPINIEILYNWPSLTKINIKLKKNPVVSNFFEHISKKKNHHTMIGVYIGNRSVAHDYYSAHDFLKKKFLSIDINIFGDISKLNNNSSKEQNLIETFWGYIPETELSRILEKVDFGLVTLNNKLSTQNIPGKFVTYCECGTPTICFANKNSSLSLLINKYDSGITVDLTEDIDYNVKKIMLFLKRLKFDKALLHSNAKKLFRENFNVKVATAQILRIREKCDF